MAEADGLFICTGSFITHFDGEDRVIQAGHTVVRAGHPILQGREGMFEPLTVHYETPQPKTGRGTRPGAAAQ